MSRIRLTEASMTYGDVCGNPIDFEREKRNQHITFNYDCTFIMTQKNRDKMNPDEIDQKKFHMIQSNLIINQEEQAFLILPGKSFAMN